jgi:hypothetical protein
MADPTPPILLERLRQQPVDSNAWRRFVELYAAWLGAWIVRMARPLGNEATTVAGEQDQEEVVRTVLLLISREVDTGRANGRAGGFRALLRKSFADCLRDHVRKKGVKVVGLEEQLTQLLEPGSPLNQTWDQEHQALVVGQLLERGRKRFTAYTWEAFRRTVLIGQTPSHAGAEMKVTSLAVMQARARVLAWMRQEAEDLLA